MKLTKTKELLDKICEMEIPVSETLKGKLVHQTFRNKLTTQIKETIYEDLADSLLSEGNILPYLTKEGVILEVPNESVANSMLPDDLGSGAISIELSVTIKSLDTDANELADEYNFAKQQAAEKARKAEKDKQAKIERDRKARELKDKKKAKLDAAMEAFKERKD